jgi:hypothetical protein
MHCRGFTPAPPDADRSGAARLEDEMERLRRTVKPSAGGGGQPHRRRFPPPPAAPPTSFPRPQDQPLQGSKSRRRRTSRRPRQGAVSNRRGTRLSFLQEGELGAGERRVGDAGAGGEPAAAGVRLPPPHWLCRAAQPLPHFKAERRLSDPYWGCGGETPALAFPSSLLMCGRRPGKTSGPCAEYRRHEGVSPHVRNRLRLRRARRWRLRLTPPPGR